MRGYNWVESCEGTDRKTEWALWTHIPPEATASVLLNWNQAQYEEVILESITIIDWL
jgi:hypothetical protein